MIDKVNHHCESTKNAKYYPALLRDPCASAMKGSFCQFGDASRLKNGVQHDMNVSFPRRKRMSRLFIYAPLWKKHLHDQEYHRKVFKT